MDSKASQTGINSEIVRVRRRQDRATRTRQKILEAATAEFASCGFDGATTRSIAARADVPHGLVVYHFETKLGIWRAVIENALQIFHEALRCRMRELEDEDDAVRLREFYRTFIRISAERPELNWIMSHEAGGEGETSARMDWIFENTIGEDADISIDLIRKVQSKGLFAEGDPAMLHYLIVGAISRLFVMQGEIARTMKRSPFDKDFLEQVADTLERVFWRQPFTPGNPEKAGPQP